MERFKLCDDCAQGCSVLFAELGEETQRALTDWLLSLQRIQYAKGATLVHDGAPAFGVHMLCRGRVKVVRREPHGKQQILKIAGAGELLGEENLLGDGVYTYYAEALEPVEAKFLERERFLALLGSSPTLARRLLRKLALEIKVMQSRLIESSFHSCKAKVARLLLVLGQAFGKPDEHGHLRLTLPRADLAGMAGISIETAIRTLSRFQERGLIDVDYHAVTLLDEDALERIAQRLEVQPVEHVL